jgi:hypothetical protein
MNLALTRQKLIVVGVLVTLIGIGVGVLFGKIGTRAQRTTAATTERATVSTPRSTPAPIDSEVQEANYIAATQDYVRDRLRDADGAKFRKMYVSRAAGPPMVCGEVNAKNGFGGYSGWQRFIAAPTGELVFLEEMMARGEMTKAWSKVC